MKLLHTDSFAAKLPEVTSPKLFQIENNKLTYHENGLLSTEIFGHSEQDRKKRFAYISLRGIEVLHPLLFDMLKTDRKLVNILLNKEKYILDHGELKKDEKGYTGITFFKELLDKYEPKNEKVKTVFNKIKDEYHDAFLNKIIVIPAGIRETGQELLYKTITPINHAYMSLLYTTRRIPQKVTSNDDKNKFTALLQYKVNYLFTTLKSELGTKQGISRQNIQAKRIDFSARAVITLDNDLSLDECGIPIQIAVKLFEPFLIKNLKKVNNLFSQPVNQRMILNMLRDVYYNKNNSPYFETIKNVLTELTKDRLVILNRAPSLHRYSIMAFKAKIITGDTITLSPFACGPFNADFDGDQMLVFHPLTKEAQEEAKKMLPSENIISSSTFDLNYSLTQNFAYFLYFATKYVSAKKPVTLKSVNFDNPKINLAQRIKVKNEITTIGRYLVTKTIRDASNETKNFPFIAESLTKDKANELIKNIYLQYGKKVFLNVLDNIKSLVKTYGSLVPDIIPNIKLSPTCYRKVDKLKKKLEEDPKYWNEIIEIIKKDIKKNYPLLADLVESKTTKLKWSKLAQALAVKGYVTSLEGNTYLIKNSQLDGLNPEELLKDASNARMGIIDRALSTRIPGYLTRQLVFALSPVKLSTTIEDCGTNKTLDILVTKDMYKQLVGRYMILNEKLLQITDKLAEELIGQKIKLRSPTFCKSKEICHTCYGEFRKFVTNNIGVIAAQAIGERGTQLIMRTFHVDAIVTKKAIELIDIPGLLKTKQGYALAKEGIITIMTEDVLTMNDYSIFAKAFIFNNLKYNIPCELSLIPAKEINKTQDKIEILFSKRAEAIIVNKQTALRDQLTEVVSLLNISSNKTITNPIALIRTLHDMYNNLGHINIIHFEVLLSQMLRDKDNPTIPYRLSNNLQLKPLLVGIKKAIFLTDPKLALLFERVTDALLTGLMFNNENHLESDLTKYHI